MELNDMLKQMVKNYGEIDSLDKIEEIMPMLIQEANDRGHGAIGMCHVVPLIDAVNLLAKEVKDLREQVGELQRICNLK